MAEEVVQTKKDLRYRMSSLEPSLEAEWDRVGKVAGDKDVLANRPGESDALRCRLQKRDEALQKAREKMTAVLSILESLHCTAKYLEKQLLVARTHIPVQPLLLEESLKEVDAKSVELKEVYSQLNRRNVELAALY